MPSSEVFSKWKHGKLRSGSKIGPKVKSHAQATAIFLSEKRKEQAHGGKYPEKAFGGPMMGPGVAGPMGATPGGMMPGMPMPMNTNVMQQPPMQGPPGGMPAGANLGVASGQPLPTAPRALAPGGVAMPGVGNFNMAKQANLNPSPMERSMDRSVMHGPVNSAVPGRTDAHKTQVPSGSYVIPADIVSGRGQGNTAAGMNVLQSMFKMGPYGTGGGMPKPGRGTMPKAMAAPKSMLPKQQSMFGASGGGKQSGHIGKPTPVHLAGGELVVPPDKLMQVVHPNLETAHAIMDKWVVKERAKLRKTLGKLPGPVKD